MKIKNDYQVEIMLCDHHHENVLRNLHAFFLHHMSIYDQKLELTKEGVYKECDDVCEMIENEHIFPYIIKVDGEIAGHVVISEQPICAPDMDYYVQFLFILNKYRRRGIGRRAMTLIFKKHKGRFCVAQVKENDESIAFWRQLYYHLHLSYIEGFGGETKGFEIEKGYGKFLYQKIEAIPESLALE